MGVRHRKAPSQEQQSLAQAQKDLLATQEVAASLIVDGLSKDAEILDLKELVANLVITTGGAV